MGKAEKQFVSKWREVWKGVVDNADISVFTGNDSAGCGINFTIGKEYLVYAHNWDMDGKSVLSTTLFVTGLLSQVLMRPTILH